MKNRLCLVALALLPVSAAFALQQDKKPTEAAAKTDEPMMLKMKEYATPGPAHKALESKVGKWTTDVKCWMEPTSEPMTSTGTGESKMVMGGRFLENTFSGTFMGQPFEGRGYCGYDNIKKKYVSTWLDSGGTGIMHSEGTYDPATKTFTYSGEGPDVMAGKYTVGRMIEKQVDNDHWTMTGYNTGPDGKEFKCMEMTFTRAK